MADANECLKYGKTSFHKNIMSRAMLWFKKALDRTFRIERDNADGHFRLGLVFAEQQLYHEAAEEMKTVLETAPQNAAAHHNLGIIYHKQGELDRAIAAFNNAIKIQPDHAAAHYNLGNAYQDRGDLIKAIEAYNNAIRIQPDHADACNNLGSIHTKQGDLDKAIEAYSNAIKIQLDHAAAHYNLGFAYEEQGDLDKAIEAYNNAIRIQPDDVAAHNNLGNVYREQGELDRAVEAYNNAIRIQPNYVAAHNNLGLAYQQRGDLDKAIKAYNNAIRIQPDDVAVHNNLGNAYREHGDLGKAIEAFTNAIGIQPGYAVAHNNLGFAYRKYGDLDKAIEAFTNAIGIQPDDVTAHNNLGNVYREQGDLDKAIKSYSNAIRIHPEYPAVHNNLGSAYREHGDLDKAIESYNNAIAIQPDYAGAHYNLAIIYHEQGELDKAIEAYNNAIRIQPDYATAHYNLGVVYQERGDLDRAIEAYNNAIAIQPDDAATYSNLGTAYQKKQKFGKAVDCWQEALRLDRRLPQPRTNLAQHYAESGMVKEALELLSDAPPHPLIHFALGKICYSQISNPDVPSSPEDRREWLDRALDAFDRAMEFLEHIPFSTRVAVFWIGAKLHIDWEGTVAQVTDQLVSYFPDHPGHLLLANLIALMVHFIEMLREMCLRDIELARHCCESILTDLEFPVASPETKLNEKAIAQLKQLSRKYKNLDSDWTFLTEPAYQDLKRYAKKMHPPQPIKNLLYEVDLLVEGQLEDIAKQRFLTPALEPLLLERLYERKIQAFEQELQEIGGLSEETLRAVYGRALEVIYQKCLIKQSDRDNHGRLTFLRHVLNTQYSDILSKIEKLGSSDTVSTEDLRHFIDRSLSSIQQRVDDLLQTTLEPMEFRLNGIFSNIDNRIGERKLDYGKANKYKSVSVYGLRPMVVTIFSNILNNAYDHFERHKPVDGIIDVYIRGNRADYVTVSFCDNGKGIPQEIIDMLRHGSNSLPTEKGGIAHGSGLVIVRDLIRAIGGQLRIKRLPKGGTMVKVRIPGSFGTGYQLMESKMEPAVIQDAGMRDIGPEIHPSAPDRLRVLVVDDSPGWLERCAAFLRERRCYVVTAEDCDSAEALFQRIRPQMVLLDVMLRYGNEGFTLMEQFRKSYGQCSIILMTREPNEQDGQLALQQGAKKYLNKRDEPVFFTELAKTLRDIGK